MRGRKDKMHLQHMCRDGSENVCHHQYDREKTPSLTCCLLSIFCSLSLTSYEVGHLGLVEVPQKTEALSSPTKQGQYLHLAPEQCLPSNEPSVNTYGINE